MSSESLGAFSQTARPPGGVASRAESRYPALKQERRPVVEFFAFDQEYVRHLYEGDAETERHFVEYFSGLLLVKLRHRLRSGQDVEDLRQEVFLRVLRSLRQGAGIRQPERLGSYVNAVCNNVIFEHLRQRSRVTQWDDQIPEPCHPNVDVERDLVSVENQQQVRTVIDELSVKDRGILRAVFLDEQDKDEVCKDFGVRREYLRVLLHRAKIRFRHLLTSAKTMPSDPHVATSTGYSHS